MGTSMSRCTTRDEYLNKAWKREMNLNEETLRAEFVSHDYGVKELYKCLEKWCRQKRLYAFKEEDADTDYAENVLIRDYPVSFSFSFLY